MGERRNLVFCQQYHFSCPFPVSELVLMAFVAFLYQEKLLASSVKNYLAAVRFSQIVLGLRDHRLGEMPRHEYVVKDFKQSAAIGPQGHRLRIRQRKQVWQDYPYRRDAAMLWAVATTVFSGLGKWWYQVIRFLTQQCTCLMQNSG